MDTLCSKVSQPATLLGFSEEKNQPHHNRAHQHIGAVPRKIVHIRGRGSIERLTALRTSQIGSFLQQSMFTLTQNLMAFYRTQLERHLSFY